MAVALLLSTGARAQDKPISLPEYIGRLQADVQYYQQSRVDLDQKLLLCLEDKSWMAVKQQASDRREQDSSRDFLRLLSLAPQSTVDAYYGRK